MRKFTPGPWKSVENSISSEMYFFANSQGKLLGETIGLTRDKDENMANANLIAAAPDMYQVIHDLIEVIQGPVDQIPEVIVKARRLLARIKAE